MADTEESTIASSTSSEPNAKGSILEYIHDSDSSSHLALAETVVPEDSASQTSSEPSASLPPVPTNTPVTRSAINATHLASQLHELTLAAAQVVLSQLPGATPPPPASEATSESSISEGKAHLRGPFRSELDLHKQLFKAPPPRPTRPPKRNKYKTKLIPHTPTTGIPRSSTTTNARSDGGVSPPNEHVHESSMWVQYAKEDMDRGMKRLRQAAEDIWRTDRSKSIKQWYSAMLADVIKKQDIEFDVSCLQ